MKFIKPIVTGLCVCYILACNHANDADVKLREPENISQKEKKEDEDFKTNRQVGNTDSTAIGSQQSPQPKAKGNPEATVDWDKKIIKTASVNLETKNYKSFNALVHENIRKYGAYVAQEEQNQTDYKIENNITIKVPVDRFDDLVAALTTGEQKLLEKKISSEDVTTQLVDIKSRMEAKKQVRLKYLDLLKQAKNMEEILNVQNEINSIQEDIEAATGRIDYLSHSASYSTINLAYFQVVNASAKDPDEPTFTSKLWESFKKGWNWVGDIFIGIISIWPLLVIGFACWLACKKWRSSKIQKPVA